jgi:beta-barrel assembly-enhancing protease
MFEGQLFDGKSSVSKKVTVLVYSDRLVIHHQKEDGAAETQSWETNKLKDYQKLAKDFIQIQYGDFPSQTLEVKSETFAETFKPPVSVFSKFIHQIVNGGITTILAISIVVFALLGFAYFYALPWLAEKSVVFVPKEYEVKMGESIYQSYIKTEEIDTAKTELANNFLKQIDFQTDYPLQITVVNSTVKNAFALPGGHVVVYTELLDNMKNYEELAALLGHEVGHVKQRHTTKNIFRSFSGYLLISIFLGDFSGVSATVLDNVNQLHQLSYSRELESEADETGFQTLKHNHINTKGMISLFENLQKGNEIGSVVPEFLSTHPVTENRMTFIKEMIRKEKPTYIKHLFLEGLFKQMTVQKADY